MKEPNAQRSLDSTAIVKTVSILEMVHHAQGGIRRSTVAGTPISGTGVATRVCHRGNAVGGLEVPSPNSVIKYPYPSLAHFLAKSTGPNTPSLPDVM